MMDEIYDRGYQAGRAELHDGVDTLLAKVRDALAPALTALHRVEWDAPWNAPARREAKH